MANIKGFVTEITKNLQSGVEYQENPDNRIVRSFRVDNSDPLVDKVYFTSDCDGFAEEEKLAITTYKKGYYSEEYLTSYEYLAYNYGVGASETEVLSDLKTSEFEELLFILERYFAEPNNELLKDAAESECCGLLITPGGGCNWANIWLLRNKGYDVYAGDKDSFGWLTGVVEKDEILLIYG